MAEPVSLSQDGSSEQLPDSLKGAPMNLAQDDEQVWPKPLIFGGSRKGAKQWQEDSYFSFISQGGRVIVGGVMDGHGGYNGLVASTTARDTALAFLQRHSLECEQWDEEKWKTILVQVFASMHDTINRTFLNVPQEKIEEEGGKRYKDERGIVRTSKGDPVHGGSTGTIVVQIKQEEGSSTLITANVGDSTAILIPTQGQFQWLSVDHGPENPDEWHRVNVLDAERYSNKLLYVYDKSSVIRKYDCPKVFLPDGRKDPKFVKNPWAHGLHPTNVRYEPAVYAVTPRCVSRDSTCIAMTRALGDFYAHQFGLTCIPDITVKHLPAGESYMIAAGSDGVWDCWKYQDFGAFVNEAVGKRRQAAEEQKVQQPLSSAPLEALPNGIQDPELGLTSQVGELTLDESIHRAIKNFGCKDYDDAALVCWFVKPSIAKPLPSGDPAASSSPAPLEDSSSSMKDEE